MNVPRRMREQVRDRARCTTGTYIDKMNEALIFTESSRQRVTDLSAEVSERARVELTHRHAMIGMRAPSTVDVAVKAGREIADDARVKLATADERWGAQLAQTYALAELVATTRGVARVLDLVYDELVHLNELLTAPTEQTHEEPS